MLPSMMFALVPTLFLFFLGGLGVSLWENSHIQDWQDSPAIFIANWLITLVGTLLLACGIIAPPVDIDATLLVRSLGFGEVLAGYPVWFLFGRKRHP